MASWPTSGVVPAVKAIKAGIWVQNHGGRGQLPALENHCCGLGQATPLASKVTAGVEREEDVSRNSHMFLGQDVKKNHGFS